MIWGQMSLLGLGFPYIWFCSCLSLGERCFSTTQSVMLCSSLSLCLHPSFSREAHVT